MKIIDEELLAEKVKEFPPLFEKAKKGYKEKKVVINPFTTMGVVNDPLKKICSYARAVCSLRLIFRKYSPKVSAFQKSQQMILSKLNPVFVVQIFMLFQKFSFSFFQCRAVCFDDEHFYSLRTRFYKVTYI